MANGEKPRVAHSILVVLLKINWKNKLFCSLKWYIIFYIICDKLLKFKTVSFNWQYRIFKSLNYKTQLILFAFFFFSKWRFNYIIYSSIHFWYYLFIIIKFQNSAVTIIGGAQFENCKTTFNTQIASSFMWDFNNGFPFVRRMSHIHFFKIFHNRVRIS